MEIKTKFNIGDKVYNNYGELLEINDFSIKHCLGFIITCYRCEDGIWYEEGKLYSKKPKKTIYNLNLGDKYWYVDRINKVIRGINDGTEYDECVVKSGNAFLTEEEAGIEAERRSIHAKLKRLAGGGKFIVNEDNYLLSYDTTLKEIRILDAVGVFKYDEVFFRTEQEVKDAIKEIGEKVLINDYFMPKIENER